MKLESNEELVSGLNTVLQIILSRPKSVHALFIGNTPSKRVLAVKKEAKKKNMQISEENSSFFEENFKDVNHQNIAIRCNKRLEESEQYLHTIINQDDLKILILDGISDPHNVGACLRSAAASDADAVIVPKNRSCHLTPTVRKISCGASELIPFIIVTNIVRTINLLKENGVMVFGSDIQAKELHDQVEFTRKNALIIGSEDKGMRRLTKENCDQLVRIQMSDKMDSLNASVSAGILLFEISRQNRINSLQIE